MADGIDVDGLAAKLAAALGRKRPTIEDEDDGRGPPRTVPYDRFRRELEARKALQTEVESIRGMVEELKTGHASSLAQVKEAAAADVAALQGRHTEDIGLIEHGFKSSTDRAVLRTVWDSLPKGDRGKSPSDYWGSVVERLGAHQADPEKATAPSVATALTPYLPSVDGGKGGGKAPPSGGNGGNWSGPPAGPAPRQGGGGIDSAPVDQGLDAFLAALPS